MTDRFTVHAVVVFIGIIAIASLAGGWMLASWGKPVPDFLISAASTALGALGALLVRTSSTATGPDIETSGPVVTTTTTEVGD